MLKVFLQLAGRLEAKEEAVDGALVVGLGVIALLNQGLDGPAEFLPAGGVGNLIPLDALLEDIVIVIGIGAFG